MTNLDINYNHLEIVTSILRRYLPAGTRIWVFGSRVKGTTRRGSDLDLAVEGAMPMDYNTMTKLSIAFDDSDLPFTVDVVDLKTVKNTFRKIIDAQKIPILTMPSDCL